MEYEQFKKLIEEAYNIYAEQGGLTGVIYCSSGTYGFRQIDDIYNFVDTANPDMLCLRSEIDGEEVSIYPYGLESYENSRCEMALYSTLSSRGEVEIKYGT